LADDEALVSTEPDDDEALVPADILAEEAPLVEAPATGQADPTATATAEVATLPPPIDFSQLEEPALLISLRGTDSTNTPLGELAVREGGGDAIVDLVRTGDLSQSFSVQFTEPNFAGSPSALDAGRYRIENEGLVVFEPGQPRARTRISVPSNNVREDDRQVTLSVRNALNRRQELAIITLSLEDDDQRNYEASLPPNTIGFLVQEITVREFDPAVQIDIVRYQPDNSAQEINFLLTDITATEGQDYFAPGMSVIYFGPGQRTARILIPLGQDSRSEPVERFTIELDTPVAPPDSNIFSRITVMIRDDDS
jgi:hypothetical protein